MRLFPVMVLLLTGFGFGVAAFGQPSPDKVASPRGFEGIQKEVETLRAKKFLRKVPVYTISAKEVRAISDRDLDKQYPGPKLHAYEELLAWMDLIPPHTDLKAVSGDFSVDQVAGLYDSDTKEMCIPSSSVGMPVAKKASEKQVPDITPEIDAIVLAHEFTPALEDQYWPLDDPKDNDAKPSTDRGTAHDFILEGSATREMIEAVPAQLAPRSATRYFFLWNLLHSDLGEFALNVSLSRTWKGSDALVNGVPESVSRQEAMPYSFGYSFCAEIMRQWGLDGLDYFYDHPLVSSAQVMHPKKSWEWREFPAQIDLPETVVGGWKQISIDSAGEAGMAILFGCQFKNLHHGQQLAHGWDGDHVALFAGPGDHGVLLWASSWDSAYAASRFVNACLQERQVTHQAVVTKTDGNRTNWKSPDGRTGFIERHGKQVILLETDEPKILEKADVICGQISFTEAPEITTRNAVNSPLRRFNPVWSWQKDGDYSVSRTLGGLLSRHDRNSVGIADRYLLGMLGESRRTLSFHKWELGGGWIARHQSDTRRGTTETTLLPWGFLASHSSARLPQSPTKIISRTSIFWGLGGSITVEETGRRSIELLPFGMLYHRTTSAAQTSTRVLGIPL